MLCDTWWLYAEMCQVHTHEIWHVIMSGKKRRKKWTCKVFLSSRHSTTYLSFMHKLSNQMTLCLKNKNAEKLFILRVQLTWLFLTISILLKQNDLQLLWHWPPEIKHLISQSYGKNSCVRCFPLKMHEDEAENLKTCILVHIRHRWW